MEWGMRKGSFRFLEHCARPYSEYSSSASIPSTFTHPFSLQGIVTSLRRFHQWRRWPAYSGGVSLYFLVILT